MSSWDQITGNVDLFLIGSGVLSFVDFTLLAEAALKRSKTICYLHNIPSLERYLDTFQIPRENLLPKYYIDGKALEDIYNDVVEHVLRVGRIAKPTALILHGHPLVYSAISRRLIRAPHQNNLRLEVVPGISSLDRIFSSLYLDIGRRGLQVYDAATAIQKKVPLNPYTDCIIFQVGHSLSAIALREVPTTVEEVKPLKDFLSQFYPTTHTLMIVEVAVELSVPTRIREVKLKELEQYHSYLNYNASLYIPAISHQPYL